MMTSKTNTGQRVRLRYSGLVVFLSKVATAFTGLYFMWLLARNLTQSSFGGVYFINGTLAFFIFFAGVIPYWSTRDVATGRGGAYVSLTFNLVMSVPFLVMYVIMASYFAGQGHISDLALLAASPIIILTFTLSSMTSTINALSPQSLAGMELLGDIIKIVAAFFLVLSFRLGLVGAEISISAAYLTSVVYAYVKLRKIVHEKTMWDFQRIKKWLSLSWLVAFSAIISYFYGGLDKYFLGIISETELGTYAIALLLARQLNPVSSLSTALYPHILRAGGEDKKASRDVLALILIFSVPMVFGLIIFSSPLLSIFSKHYALVSKWPLLLLAIAYFISSSFFSFFDSLIYGSEKIELTSRQLFQSKFFQGLLMQATVLAVMAPVMWVLAVRFGAVGMAFAILIGSMLMLTGRIFIAGKRIRGIFPLDSFLRSVLSSIIMSFILLLLPRSHSYIIILDVFVAAVVYFASMYVIDKRVRAYSKYFLQSLRPASELDSHE